MAMKGKIAVKKGTKQEIKINRPIASIDKLEDLLSSSVAFSYASPALQV